MISQPRGNHPRFTIGVGTLSIHSIIFKDFTDLLNGNIIGTNARRSKELLLGSAQGGNNW
jgi:hypothetical protein